MKRSIRPYISWICVVALVFQLVSSTFTVGAVETMGEVQNLALNKVAVATYEQMDGDYQAYASNAVDGDYNSRWSTFGGPSLPGAIQVDLGATCELASLATYWFGVGRTYTYSVYLTDSPMIVNNTMQSGSEPVASGLTARVAVQPARLRWRARRVHCVPSIPFRPR